MWGAALHRALLAAAPVPGVRADQGRPPGHGAVVPAGEGDGEIRRTARALHRDGFDGYFSLEPHLAEAGAMGGFSGPELFAAAHHAFTRLLADESIEHR